MADERTELQIAIVYYLARNGVTGGHNKTVDTVKNRAGIAVHEQGDAEEVIRELVRDPAAPVEAYGGQRDAIRLTSMQDAVEFIEERGGEPPFGV